MRKIAIAALFAAGLTLASARSARAQQQTPAPNPDSTPPAAPAKLSVPSGPFNASFDFGGRGFLQSLTPQQMGMLTLYKDVYSGAVVQQFTAGYTAPDSVRSMQFVGRNLGAFDQSLWFRGNQPGLFDFQVRSDKIPHTFSTTARENWRETAPGVYALPAVRNDTAALNASQNFLPVRSIWDPTKVSLTLTPTPNWDMKAEYTNVDKNGGRPMGMAFGGSSNNAEEIVEPIDQTLQSFRLTQSYARQRFQLLGTYDLSVFSNNLSSVTSANPLLAVDAATGAANGRTALAPSNVAHNVSGTGAVNLPFDTRVTATGSYGWWRQNIPFIPVTDNSLITDPRIAQEPASLGGETQTGTFATSLSSRPVSPVSITAHYRSYVLRDHADNYVVPLLVVNDRSISPADSGVRDPFRRDNSDVGFNYRLPIPISVGGSYNWERMQVDSAIRNIGHYVETTPRATLDFTGIDWATFRASYSKSRRRADEYHEAVPSATGNPNPSFMRFDLADRNRERVNLSLDVTPIDPVTVSGMYQVGHDDYPNSVYGVQSDKNNAVGADISFSPSARVVLGAGYSAERYEDFTANLYRTGTQLANTSYQWTAHNTDRSNTASANATFIVVPNKIETGGTFELSHSKFLMAAFNPVTPTGGTAAQNLSATASDLPEVSQTFQPLSLYLRYHLRPEWAMTFRFQGELFGQNDFRTIGCGGTAGCVYPVLHPATGNYIFLGNNYMNYNAQLLTVTISYRPSPIAFGRSTI